MFHTLAVKDMVTLGLNSVLSYVIAKPADSGFAKFLAAEEPIAIGLAPENQVRVTSHLAHTSESDKSMFSSQR